jgi:NADH:ubiquinone oxidoreductase subunit C
MEEETNNYQEGLKILYPLLQQIESLTSNPVVTNDLQREVYGLFGVFPIENQQKSAMIMLELIRVHTKRNDYRNAYKMCQRLD